MAQLPRFEQLGFDVPKPQTAAVGYQAASGVEEAPSQAATKFGEAVQQIAFHQQDMLNTTRAEDAWNQYKQKALDLSVGEGGFATLKGGNAVNGNMYQTYSGKLGEARKAIESQLGDDDLRKRFTERANVTDLQFKDHILRHYSTERDAYEKQTFDGTVAAAANMVGAAPLDQSIFDTALLNVNRRAEALASHQGITDKDAIAKIKDGVKDALLVKRLDALLYSNPVAADQLFRLTSDQISNPEARLVMQHKIREASLGINASIEAQKAIEEVRALPETMTVKFTPGTKEKELAAIDVALARDPNNPELLQAKYVIESHEGDEPTTSGLPHARDVAAQLPLVLHRVEKAADRLYGKDPLNPDRAAFVKRMEMEVRSKLTADVQQLNAIQRQAQGTLFDAILGARTTGAEGGVIPTGGQPKAAPVLTAFSQIQGDPRLMRAWQIVDPGMKPALLNLMAKNVTGEPAGDERLYRELWNRVHLEPGDPKKIDYYKQIVDPAVAGRLSMPQIQSLRAEIERNETPGGRSVNQMKKAADANVTNWFRTTLNSNMMFMEQKMTNPTAYIDWSMKWNDEVGKKIDDYVKAGQPEKVRALFMPDTPESVISAKYLQTFLGPTTTAAEALSKAAKPAKDAAQAAPVAHPKNIDTREKLDAWFQTLPPNVTTFIGSDGKVRAVPGRTQQQAAPNYGLRQDGTQKGNGYFGPLPTKDGQVMTEYSIGVNIGGQEREIPTLVPTLTKEEIASLLRGAKPTAGIIDKAVAHAKTRIAAGKDPFAGPGEQIKPPAGIKPTPGATGEW